MTLDIALQPKQQALYRLIEAEGLDVATTIGYGGALGGGKSGAVRRIQLARRFKYPRTNGVIVRRVFEELKRNHIDPLWLEYPELRRFYRVSDHELNLPNGSKLLFMYAETASEVQRKFTGIEFFDISVDQAEQFSEGELRHFKTRARWPGMRPGQCKTAFYFNPGGPGAEYLRRVLYLHQYRAAERASEFAFIQAYGWDNYEWFRGLGITEKDFYALSNDQRFELFISSTQYGRELNALPPALRAGHLMGSFESFAGQYFAGVWDEAKTILTIDEAERLIEPWWTRWTATDWGFAHHTAHLWFATGKIAPAAFESLFQTPADWPVDVVVVYRELIATETAEDDLARMMIERTPEAERPLVQHEFLSPDAFAKKGSANTVAEQFADVFARYRMPSPEPADNDRVGGWRLLYHGFKQSCALRGAERVTREMAESGPMLVISAACPTVIASAPLLIRDDRNLEDVLKTPTLADDVGDGLRYGYKSMLDPRTRAPKEIRAREIFASYQDPTARAIAMQRFEAAERARSSALRRPRGR